jgi:hypothetical protein
MSLNAEINKGSSDEWGKSGRRYRKSYRRKKEYFTKRAALSVYAEFYIYIIESDTGKLRHLASYSGIHLALM